jgi:hypothetical protein
MSVSAARTRSAAVCPLSRQRATRSNQISRGNRRSMPHQIATRPPPVTTLFVERLRFWRNERVHAVVAGRVGVPRSVAAGAHVVDRRHINRSPSDFARLQSGPHFAMFLR